MSDVPGPPISPQGDQEHGEPAEPAVPRWADGSDRDFDSNSAGLFLPPIERTDHSAGNGRPTSGHADGVEAQSGDTLPYGAGATAAGRLGGDQLGGDRLGRDRLDRDQFDPDRRQRDRLAAISRVTSGPTPMKIGIWGSPASGKSTLLAALQHATGHTDGRLGHWTLIPQTEDSKDVLIRWTQRLIEEHKFPEATRLAAATELRWRFRGDLAGSKYQPLLQRLRHVPAPGVFDLDLIDVSGEVFGFQPTERDVPVDLVGQTLDHLASANGLIYLFDPITELTKPAAAGFMNRPLVELLSRVESKNRTVGGRLPHYISVCVTKFDDPRLFQQACRAGFVNTGRDGRPRVLDKHAERFFNALCDGTFWERPGGRGTNGPRFVRDMLRQNFHRDRIRYYVTSSVGFHLGDGGRFDPTRYTMVREEDETEGFRIIGPIGPINVLEPLVDLYMKLRFPGLIR
ncbi:MAG TPA: hypothetical protein VKU77_39265 [Streptosporangiaceae bacterium]|nr:hypothetical protein [Streptosporangiaceae bacterium]